MFLKYARSVVSALVFTLCGSSYIYGQATLPSTLQVTDWGDASFGVQVRVSFPETLRSGTDLGINAHLRYCGTGDSQVVVSGVVATIEIWNEQGDSATACFSDMGYPDTLSCANVEFADSSVPLTYSFAWSSCRFSPLAYDLIRPIGQDTALRQCFGRLWLNYYNSRLSRCDRIASPTFQIGLAPQIVDTFSLVIIAPLRVALDEQCNYVVVAADTLGVQATRDRNVIVGILVKCGYVTVTGGAASSDTVNLVNAIE